MYYLLTENFKSQEQKLVALIREAAEVQCIYMLGSTLTTRRTESVFMQEAPSCRSADCYYVLVLINSNENVNAVQDKIENRAFHLVTVTAIVMPTQTFTTWLAKGHPFACKVYRQAVLLYKGDGEELAAPEFIATDVVKNPSDLYNEANNKVTEFIAGADLFMLRSQTKLAAFMFHQASEQLLRALFQITTGMYVNTHSIDKLMRYCSMACPQLPEIFARNNEKGEKLFQLLQKAYIGGRYEREYYITLRELEMIRGSIMELKEVLHGFKDYEVM